MDIKQVETTLKEYVISLNLPKEVEPRIEKMYLKEMEHIFSMNEKIKTLNPFKKIWNGFVFDSNEFLVENEKELTNKTIENVNKIFRKFIQ